MRSMQAEIFGEFQNCKELLNAMSFLIRAQQSVNVELKAHILKISSKRTFKMFRRTFE